MDIFLKKRRSVTAMNNINVQKWNLDLHQMSNSHKYEYLGILIRKYPHRH